MFFLKRDNRKGVSQFHAGNAVKSIKIGRPFKNANARDFNGQPFSDSFLSASVLKIFISKSSKNCSAERSRLCKNQVCRIFFYLKEI